MDSPGYSAQYCTYTFMEHSSSNIIHAEVVDKRHTGLNSVAMEAKGFDWGLSFLLNKGLNIVEVVTDQHSSIILYMSMYNIYNSF